MNDSSLLHAKGFGSSRRRGDASANRMSCRRSAGRQLEGLTVAVSEPWGRGRPAGCRWGFCGSPSGQVGRCHPVPASRWPPPPRRSPSHVAARNLLPSARSLICNTSTPTNKHTNTIIMTRVSLLCPFHSRICTQRPPEAFVNKHHCVKALRANRLMPHYAPPHIP